MKTSTYNLKITFTTSVLGTQPQKPVATEFITNRFADRVGASGENIPTNANGLPEDEVATLSDELDKGTTAFHKLDGQPIFYDYMLKGFFKEAASVFNGKVTGGVKNLKSKVDNTVFVTPRQIRLWTPPGSAITICERPLRAQTMQGPRTALARSEELPAGTWFECQIKVYQGEITETILNELLGYGADKGLGQWRNGGHGQFTFELEKVSE